MALRTNDFWEPTEGRIQEAASAKKFWILTVKPGSNCAFHSVHRTGSTQFWHRYIIQLDPSSTCDANGISKPCSEQVSSGHKERPRPTPKKRKKTINVRPRQGQSLGGCKDHVRRNKSKAVTETAAGPVHVQQSVRCRRPRQTRRHAKAASACRFNAALPR